MSEGIKIVLGGTAEAEVIRGPGKDADVSAEEKE